MLRTAANQLCNHSLAIDDDNFMEAKLQILLTGCSAVTIILLINFVSDVMWQKRGNQDDRLKRCKLFTELVKKMKLKAFSVSKYIFWKKIQVFV